MSVYSFITKPFRYSEQVDQNIRSAYTLARTVEIEGRLSNLNDADQVSQTLFNILKAPRLRFEVPVLGVDVVTVSDFDGSPLCATLTMDRFGLSQGLLVVIPDFVIRLNQGQTVLRCWG